MGGEKTEEGYSILKLFRNFGILKILINFDSVPSYILTSIISFFYLNSNNFFQIAKDISLALIGANAGLLGVVIAGFAIIVSMMDKNFIVFLKKFELYEDTVFQFVIISGLVSVGLLSSIGLSLSLPFNHIVSKIIFPIAVLSTLWGTLSIVLLLIVFLKDLAMLKGDFSDLGN